MDSEKFTDIFCDFLTKTSQIFAEQATTAGIVFPLPEPMISAPPPEEKKRKKKQANKEPKKDAPQPSNESEPTVADPDEVLIALAQKSTHILSENFIRSAKRKTGLDRNQIREHVAKLRAEGKIREEDTA